MKSYLFSPLFRVLIFIMIIDKIIGVNCFINESKLEFQAYDKNNSVSYLIFNHNLQNNGVNKIWIQENTNTTRSLDSKDLMFAADNSKGSNSQTTTTDETSYSSIIIILVVWSVVGLWGILLLVVFIIIIWWNHR